MIDPTYTRARTQRQPPSTKRLQAVSFGLQRHFSSDWENQDKLQVLSMGLEKVQVLDGIAAAFCHDQQGMTYYTPMLGSRTKCSTDENLPQKHLQALELLQNMNHNPAWC